MNSIKTHLIEMVQELRNEFIGIIERDHPVGIDLGCFPSHEARTTEDWNEFSIALNKLVLDSHTLRNANLGLKACELCEINIEDGDNRTALINFIGANGFMAIIAGGGIASSAHKNLDSGHKARGGIRAKSTISEKTKDRNDEIINDARRMVESGTPPYELNGKLTNKHSNKRLSPRQIRRILKKSGHPLSA